MSKKIKQLVILLVVLVVVGGGALALTLIKPTSSTDSSSSTSSTTETVTILPKMDSDVYFDYIKVKNENGEFTVKGKKSDISTTYSVEELEGTSIVTATVTQFTSSLSPLGAMRKLTDIKDYADYGLADPKITAEIKYSDNKTVKILVGNKYQDNAYYVKKADENDVYLAVLDDVFFAKQVDFVDTLVVYDGTVDKDGNAVTDFGKITISGGVLKEPVVIKTTKTDDLSDPLYTSKYYMESPKRYPMYANCLDEFMPYLANLESDEVVAVNPTDEQLAEYGFKENPTVIEYTLNDGEYKLYGGKVTDTHVYVMNEKSHAIYKAKKAQTPWAYMTAFDMRDSYVYLMNSRAVSDFTVKLGNDSYEFIRKRTLKDSTTSSHGVLGTSSTATSSTEDKKEYDYDVYYQGKKIDSKIMSNFYLSIIGITKEEQLPEEKIEVSGTPDITITYNYYDDFNRTPNTVTIYKTSTRRALLQINGEDDCLISSDHIENITKTLKEAIK